MYKNKFKNKLLNKFTRVSLEHSVYMQSKGRTTDIDLLTSDELSDLYYMFFPHEKIQTNSESILKQEKELKRLRSVILTDAQYIGLYKPNSWTNFNLFMQQNSVFKKGLNQYQIDEFPKLIKQFKSMRYKFDKNKMVTGTSAWYHFLGIKPSLN